MIDRIKKKNKKNHVNHVHPVKKLLFRVFRVFRGEYSGVPQLLDTPHRTFFALYVTI